MTRGQFAGIKIIVNPLLPRDSFMLVCNPRENETLAEYIERQGLAIVKNMGEPELRRKREARSGGKAKD